MDIRTAITQRRTIRRFQNKPIDTEMIRDLVNLARLYASGGNHQPIRFIGVTSKPILDRIFPLLRWAAYLPGFAIADDQHPMAYIILTAEGKARQFDVGAAATTLMLAAEGEGLGSCCLASFDRPGLKGVLQLPENTEPALVIALGYPDQKSRSVDYIDNVKYYEDEDGCLCVPKRTLNQVLDLR